MSKLKKELGNLATISIVLILFLLTWIPIFNRSRLFRKMGTSALKPFVRSFGVKVNFHSDIKNLPKRYIMIANHVSALDIMLLLPYFPDLYVVSDVIHEKIPVFGRIAKFANTIPIDRKSHTSRMIGVEKLVEHLNKNHNVLIFPQATTSDKIEHFLQGAFIASKKTLLPIVPVFMVFNPLDVFHLRLGEPYKAALDKLRTVENKSVYIHVFPAFKPTDYATPEEFTQSALQQYQTWYKEFQH